MANEHTATARQLRKLPLEWVTPPQQVRTHATLVKLLDAGEALLDEKPWNEISVAEIAKKAGSSVGAFYRRFSDKDSLLHAIHERFVGEAMATADSALDPDRWREATLPELVAESLGFVMSVMRERHGLDRAVFERALYDDVFKERSNRLNSYVVRGMTELVFARRDAITHPDPEVAVNVALRQAFGFITDTCTVGVNDYGLHELDDATLAKEIARSFTSYLGVRYD
jgi:AcrR family transcriptional regulator